ncbi:MAG: ribonuclease P [Methanothrix sp.]|nr:ribonuclease P [Methanothrix sp.]
MRRRRGVQQARDLALQRMERLFYLAAEEHPLHPERSDRYVEIAMRIATRIRVRMPGYLKRQFCKQCGCFLPASETRVRLRSGVLTSTCLRCGWQRRRPIRASRAGRSRCTA